MRALVVVALASGFLASGAALPDAGEAQAQQRRTRGLAITVTPRSFLDAGKVVPVGRYQNYVSDHQSFGAAPSVGMNVFSSQPLPDRFSGGRGSIPVDFQAPAFLAK